MWNFIKQPVSYYIHIASYTLLGQLIIYGVQWPILMAWGYAVHPLSLLGNILFMPLIFTLIALLSCIFVCYLCALPSTPLFICVRYLIDLWLAILPYAVDNMYWTFACPHMSIVLAIPLITVCIAWYVPYHGNKIICLIAFFCITSAGLKLATPVPQIKPVHSNIKICQLGTHIVLYYAPRKKHARYTDNWIRYTLLPTLRAEYGTETIDYVISNQTCPTPLKQQLATYNIMRYHYVSLPTIVAVINRLGST